MSTLPGVGFTTPSAVAPRVILQIAPAGSVVTSRLWCELVVIVAQPAARAAAAASESTRIHEGGIAWSLGRSSLLSYSTHERHPLLIAIIPFALDQTMSVKRDANVMMT